MAALADMCGDWWHFAPITLVVRASKASPLGSSVTAAELGGTSQRGNNDLRVFSRRVLPPRTKLGSLGRGAGEYFPNNGGRSGGDTCALRCQKVYEKLPLAFFLRECLPKLVRQRHGQGLLISVLPDDISVPILDDFP